MRKFIGTKMVEAEPCAAWKDMGNHKTGARGYKVRYPDGYESWSPKDAFERAYLPVEVDKNLTIDKPSISQKMVDDFIADVQAATLGEKTTVVRVILRNGFEIVDASSCVSPENYSKELGTEICMKRIKEKVWMLLGFLLQTAVNGING